MKNHYFGDVNDYRKYGLIRALTGQGTLNSMICWMLTEDDDRADGGKDCVSGDFHGCSIVTSAQSINPNRNHYLV